MSSDCPTVRVVSPQSPGGYKIINESDLTADDEIWKEQAELKLTKIPREAQRYGAHSTKVVVDGQNR